MRARRRRARFVWDAVGVLVFVVIAFPVYWMIASAFKPDEELNSATPTWFSLHPTLSHFRDAMNRPFFWDGVKNSLIVVSVTVALSMVVAFLAAIALAKFRFTGRKLFIVLIIGIQMLPQAGLIIPLYVVLAFPVYWMIESAFKPDDELNGASPTWFSLHPTLSHFRDAIAKPFFWDGVKNSLVVVSVTVVLSMVLAFLAAIALA